MRNINGLEVFYPDGSSLVFFKNGAVRPICPHKLPGESQSWKEFCRYIEEQIIRLSADDRVFYVPSDFWKHFSEYFRIHEPD